MYDAVTVANVPADATLVAGYGDGYWNNAAAFKARFPGAIVVEIAVSSHDNLGQVLDVETGDATPAEAPGWVQMRRAAGVHPTVYCNSSTWPQVRAAFASAGVAEPEWWIAQYDNDPTLFPGTVAKQYADPGPYDLSSVAPFWPGIDPTPSEADVPLTPADAELVASTLLNTRVPDQFRKDAHGQPQMTPVSQFFTFGDHHFDVLSGQISTLTATVEALAGQLTALVTAVEKLAPVAPAPAPPAKA
jgi:hypothetical protein